MHIPTHIFKNQIIKIQIISNTIMWVLIRKFEVTQNSTIFNLIYDLMWFYKIDVVIWGVIEFEEKKYSIGLWFSILNFMFIIIIIIFYFIWDLQ